MDRRHPRHDDRYPSRLTRAKAHFTETAMDKSDKKELSKKGKGGFIKEEKADIKAAGGLKPKKMGKKK